MFRVVLIVVCVLGLLWAFGSKLQKMPTQPITSYRGDAPTVTMSKIHGIKKEFSRGAKLPEWVPTHMIKNGKRMTLSEEQRQIYAILRAFFKNDPVMVHVAACESSLWHALPDGRLQVGPDGLDVGAFMVRVPVHAHELLKYDLDPTRFEHNVAFATMLYRRDGLRHWKSSRTCWETIAFT